MIDFALNHFELFGLPVRFAVDAQALEARYGALQRDVHPDRHAGDAVAQRQALQAAARVNEAYRTLKDPVERANILAYLSTRTPGDDPALFVGVLGRRLSPTILAAAFRRYAEAAGVSKRKRVTPHTLRHVFASELLSAGANLRQIQELLGHKHLDSTQRYTHVTAHQLRGAVKRLHFGVADADAAADAAEFGHGSCPF